MNSDSTSYYGPWNQFWDVVLPPVDVRYGSGLIGCLFALGVGILFIVFIVSRNRTYLWLYSAWCAGVGAVLTISLTYSTFSGSHGFWERAPWETFYLYSGYSVRTFALLYLPLIVAQLPPLQRSCSIPIAFPFLCVMALSVSLLCLMLILTWDFVILP